MDAASLSLAAAWMELRIEIGGALWHPRCVKTMAKVFGLFIPTHDSSLDLLVACVSCVIFMQLILSAG